HARGMDHDAHYPRRGADRRHRRVHHEAPHALRAAGDPRPPDQGRDRLMRALLRKAAALSLVGAVGVVAGAGLYARFIHPFRPRVNHQFVELPRAHKHLDGVTIAFVTDLHVGPHFTAEDLEPTIQALRHLRADIVLFGGDYISESPRYLADVQEPLTRMASTARIGSWGMLGNHDVANIRSRVMEML